MVNVNSYKGLMKPKSQVRNGLIATDVMIFQAKNMKIPFLPGCRSRQVILECKKYAATVATRYEIMVSSQSNSLVLPKTVRAKVV